MAQRLEFLARSATRRGGRSFFDAKKHPLSQLRCAFRRKSGILALRATQRRFGGRFTRNPRVQTKYCSRFRI